MAILLRRVVMRIAIRLAAWPLDHRRVPSSQLGFSTRRA